MKMKSVVMMLICLVATGSVAADDGPKSSNPKLIVAASSSSGTYRSMLTEIKEFCASDDGPLEIQELPDKGGATDNLAALKDNKASLAFLHSDVVYAMAREDPTYRNLKTLVALYPEPIHIIALRESSTKTKGTFGTSFGAETVVFNTLVDLRGYKVAAAGGGCITANVLKGQGEINFEVLCKDSGKDALSALDSGEVQAAVFVGGAPLPNIEKLTPKYKLLPIPENLSPRFSGIYQPATISYPNLKSGVVRTLAPYAILLTRQYTRPAMVAPQAALRKCFYDHLDDLKETPNKHPAWQQVDPQNHGTWDWYEIPQTGGAPVKKPAVAPTKVKL